MFNIFIHPPDQGFALVVFENKIVQYREEIKDDNNISTKIKKQNRKRHQATLHNSDKERIEAIKKGMGR